MGTALRWNADFRTDIRIVSQAWVYACLERRECVDEAPFSLGEGSRAGAGPSAGGGDRRRDKGKPRARPGRR